MLGPNFPALVDTNGYGKPSEGEDLEIVPERDGTKLLLDTPWDSEVTTSSVPAWATTRSKAERATTGHGGNGTDLLRGGAGRDTLNGGPGSDDVCREAAGVSGPECEL